MLKKLMLSAGLFLGGFAVALATNSLYWSNGQGFPGTNGPWLGDNFYNINTLFTAQARDTGGGFSPNVSISQTVSQAGCTNAGNDAFIEIKTNATAGALCLPTAIAGKRTTIGNASGVTLTIFSNLVSFTPGTTDTINGAAGSSGYVMAAVNTLAVCAAANNGAWYCSSGK